MGQNIKLINRTKKRESKEYRVDMVSPYFENSLSKWGIVPNKTYVGEFPDINKVLFSHYIRGLIDGDGCISYSGSSKSIFLCGSENIIKTTASILEKYIGIIPYIKSKPVNVKTGYQLWYWDVQNIKGVQTIGDWIYKDATVYLERKHNKMLEILERWPV